MEENNWCVICLVDGNWVHVLERDEPIRLLMMTKHEAEGLCKVMSLEYESRVVQYAE